LSKVLEVGTTQNSADSQSFHRCFRIHCLATVAASDFPLEQHRLGFFRKQVDSS